MWTSFEPLGRTFEEFSQLLSLATLSCFVQFEQCLNVTRSMTVCRLKISARDCYMYSTNDMVLIPIYTEMDFRIRFHSGFPTPIFSWTFRRCPVKIDCYIADTAEEEEGLGCPQSSRRGERFKIRYSLWRFKTDLKVIDYHKKSRDEPFLRIWYRLQVSAL